jgi:hypothetical protein
VKIEMILETAIELENAANGTDATKMTEEIGATKIDWSAERIVIEGTRERTATEMTSEKVIRSASETM